MAIGDGAVREEIEALHRFLVAWFSGACENSTDVLERELLGRLDRSFMLIQPGGGVLSRESLGDALAPAHGANPDFRIAVRNVQVRFARGEYLLVTYEEWQRNARASTPPDNGRLSSVLFEIANGFNWLHLQETWLPEPAMRAGPYDF